MLFDHEYLELTPSRVELKAELVDSPRFGRIRTVEPDGSPRAGEDFQVRVSLDMGNGRGEVVDLSLAVPDTFVAGLYRLEVGMGWDLMEYEDGDGEDETVDELLDRVGKTDPGSVLKLRLSLMEQTVEDEDYENEDFEYAWYQEVFWEREMNLVLSGYRWLEVMIPRE